MPKVKRVDGKGPTKPFRKDEKKSLLRRMADALMFWRGNDARDAREHARQKVVEQLSDLWQPSETLERDLAARKARILSTLEPEALPSPDPREERRRLRRMRKEAKQLHKAAQKMTRMAVRGKIPLEKILPLAFPELEKWKLGSPSKTIGLKPFQYVDVPDATLGDLVDHLRERPELAPHWSHRLESLCAAVAGALLFMAEGGDEDDALTILGLNCGPLRAEAEGCVRALRGASLPKIRQGIVEFAERAAADPRWNKPPIAEESLRALAGAVGD